MLILRVNYKWLFFTCLWVQKDDLLFVTWRSYDWHVVVVVVILFSSVSSVEPVSYTHLDVYKRQGYSIVASLYKSSITFGSTKTWIDVVIGGRRPLQTKGQSQGDD